MHHNNSPREHRRFPSSGFISPRPTSSSSSQQQQQQQQQQYNQSPHISPKSNNHVTTTSSSHYFIVVVNGVICHAEYPGNTRLCCDYRFVYGSDWEVVRVTGESACLVAGMTQAAERAKGTRPIYTWNFPLEITFRSTNPYGWPKLLITVSEAKDNLPIVGYGWCHIPVNPGRYCNVIRLFKPRSSSIIQSLLSSITGKQPELINPATACSSEGREVMRTVSEGAVKVTFDIMTKDMHNYGFEKPEISPSLHNQTRIGRSANGDRDVLDDEYSSLDSQPSSKRIY